jgi:molybdopterin-containing oxidoreductase family membrane subunit
MMTCNVFFLHNMWFKVRTSIMFSFIISIVVNIGMWLRFVIIVTSLHRDYLPSSGQCFHQHLLI